MFFFMELRLFLLWHEGGGALQSPECKHWTSNSEYDLFRDNFKILLGPFLKATLYRLNMLSRNFAKVLFLVPEFLGLQISCIPLHTKTLAESYLILIF